MLFKIEHILWTRYRRKVCNFSNEMEADDGEDGDDGDDGDDEDCVSFSINTQFMSMSVRSSAEGRSLMLIRTLFDLVWVKRKCCNLLGRAPTLKLMNDAAGVCFFLDKTICNFTNEGMRLPINDKMVSS